LACLTNKKTRPKGGGLRNKLAKSANFIFDSFSPSKSPQDNIEIFKSNDEQMISYEIIYEPNTKDAHGEWMSAETVADACDNFNMNLEKGVVKPNLYHLANTDLFSIESTWIQKEFDVKVVDTGELIKAGSWVAKLKYHSKDLWELKKANIVGGVSIGGTGQINKETGEITNVSFDLDPVEELDTSKE